MPIKIPTHLPARQILEQENVFIMDEERALSQDIRPLHIAILNLMPKKIETETQILRLLGNTPLQIKVDLMQTGSYIPKNTPAEHLLQFYKTFEELKQNKYDGMIITGAPVEHLPFEDVDYWPELSEVFQWTKTNVFSTLNICWAAQAALYHDFGIEKYPIKEKMFGVFEHEKTMPNHPLLHGFDDVFLAPHSRHTEVREKDIAAHPELEVISVSKGAGLYLAGTKDRRHFYATGHSEYDGDTLAQEYYRDLKKGLDIAMPVNYFREDNPELGAPMRWRAHSHLLFSNWINYFVYQETPYDFVDGYENYNSKFQQQK